MIARFVNQQLPPWARTTHPMMRYALGYRALSRREFYMRGMLSLVVLLLTLGLAYFYTQQDSETITYRQLLYYPLAAMQLLLQLLAIAFTTNVIALERQKGTWETLQITLSGAGNVIRTRWALVFYRLRWALVIMFILRLGYIFLLLNDATDFEGRALDVRIISIAPEVSLETAVFLLAALITAAVMQPFIALAFDGAVGILVGSVVHSRNVGILTTVTLMILRIVMTIGALFLGGQIIDQNGTTPKIAEIANNEAWARTLFLSVEGDQSLRLLHLETMGNLWSDLNNGIYLGGIMLGIVILMAVLANLMVLFAAWWAAKPSRV